MYQNLYQYKRVINIDISDRNKLKVELRFYLHKHDIFFGHIKKKKRSHKIKYYRRNTIYTQEKKSRI